MTKLSVLISGSNKRPTITGIVGRAKNISPEETGLELILINDSSHDGYAAATAGLAETGSPKGARP